jgi:signal transduction histidine kinase
VPEIIYSDKKRFKQILFNLIGNSCKFTFNGFIQIKVHGDSQTLITEVEDSGVGIKQEDLAKLFKFFGKL